MAVRKVELSAGDTGYVTLPEYRNTVGSVKKTTSIDELLPGYNGPRIHLDFNADGQLVGIEILVPIAPATNS
jgi:hypothetical protein